MTPGKGLWWSALGLALFAGFFPGHAQEQKDNPDDVFWEVRQRQESGSAAQLILARDPLTTALMRAEGLRWKVWREPEYLSDGVPALDPDWLELVRDGTPMPDFRGKAEDEKRADQIAVYKVWTQAVVNAFNTPVDAFVKSAEENAHVTFAHLWTSPEKYRGKVIPIKGRLARVRKFEATLAAQKQGVRHVYEGWILGPTKGSHPFCVLFTNLPDGLKEADKMDREVSFIGYFLKKMKYPAGDGSKYLETPVFIGPTVTLSKGTATGYPVASVPMTVVVWVAALIVTVAVGLVLVSWYFRRGDQALKKRLAQMQAERPTDFIDMKNEE